MILAACLGLLSAGAQADALPMWSVSGAGNQVYILGSIHFLRPGRDRLPRGIIDAYDQSDVLIMELDLDDLDPLASQSSMQALGVDPKGRTLDQLLGQRDYRIASSKAQAIGFDLGLMSSFEPWMAALMISQLQIASLGYDAGSGVEQQLVALAARDRKEIRGLETLEEQLTAMDTLPESTQRAFLMQTLDDAATIEEQVEQIVTAWKNGDTVTLQAEFLDGLKSQPDLYRRIVVDRNRSWARQIRPLLHERRNYLVVVGTLHLVGPDSLIAMLGESGRLPRQVGAD